MEKYGKIAKMVHFLIKNSYGGKENLNYLDLTCGNGNDTLFLCNLAGNKGYVKAFDILEEAIERTEELLRDNCQYNNYELIHSGHEDVEKYLNEKIDVAVFNLGYLPKYNKEHYTKPETTIKAITSLLPYLKDEGRIYITAYIGHDEGYEISKIFDFLKDLDKRKYNVIQIKLINKNNLPPELFIVEKNA